VQVGADAALLTRMSTCPSVFSVSLKNDRYLPTRSTLPCHSDGFSASRFDHFNDTICAVPSEESRSLQQRGRKAIDVQGRCPSWRYRTVLFFNETEKQLGHVDILVTRRQSSPTCTARRTEMEFIASRQEVAHGLLLTSKRACKQFGEKRR